MQRAHTKALLMEDTNLSNKTLLMEGNTIHNFKITKRTLSRQNSFKCMIEGTNLTSFYTQLDILSLSLVAPIFFPSILKSPWKDISWHTASLPLESYCWNIINSLILYNWSYKPCKDKSLRFHISKFTLLNT